MFYSLSKRISNRLSAKEIISVDEEEICTYGLFMLLSHINLFIVSFIIGLTLKCLLESILFYVQFQAIRRYAGGYHASAEWRCNVMSGLSVFICIWMIKHINANNAYIVLLIITAVSAVVIIILSPVDTKEKPLTETEYRRFRRITICVLFVLIAIILILFLLDYKHWLTPTCLSIILESVLLVAGKVKNSIIDKKMNENNIGTLENYN